MTFARTPETLEALEEQICRNNGDLNAAARALHLSPRHVHMWTLADPEAAQRIRQAQMIGWAGLESVLYERAVTGIEEDVYYQGDVVGTKTVRSDSLLALMAKARIPGYGESTHLHTHMVNVQLMPRATSYEEWQAQREQALAPPGEVVDVVPKVIGYHADPGEPSPQAKAAEWLMRKPEGLRDVL